MGSGQALGPSESAFEIVKGLHPHAPIYCDVFPEPQWVKYRLLKNIRELWRIGETEFYYFTHDCISRKFAVEKTLHGFGLPLKLPSIEENLFSLVSCNSAKNLQKGPLGFFH